MDPFGKKELLNFYNRHLKDFGDAPQAVRWTPEGQLHRYETLIGIAGDFSGKRVLDFGCGKGYFFVYLQVNSVENQSLFCHSALDAESRKVRFQFLLLDSRFRGNDTWA